MTTRAGNSARIRSASPGCCVAYANTPDQLVALDDALARLAALDHLAGELVKLRYFAGLGLDQAAAALGVSTATAYRHWSYARAWLRSELLKST